MKGQTLRDSIYAKFKIGQNSPRVLGVRMPAALEEGRGPKGAQGGSPGGWEGSAS